MRLYLRSGLARMARAAALIYSYTARALNTVYFDNSSNYQTQSYMLASTSKIDSTLTFGYDIFIQPFSWPKTAPIGNTPPIYLEKWDGSGWISVGFTYGVPIVYSYSLFYVRKTIPYPGAGQYRTRAAGGNALAHHLFTLDDVGIISNTYVNVNDGASTIQVNIIPG